MVPVRQGRGYSEIIYPCSMSVVRFSLDANGPSRFQSALCERLRDKCGHCSESGLVTAE